MAVVRPLSALIALWDVAIDGFAAAVVVVAPVEVLASIHLARSVGNFHLYVRLFVSAPLYHQSVPLVSMDHRSVRVSIYLLL